ncbi:hypothetical protein PoMZ_02559 [Pyricularia oryzae]|uniref:Uncharacterized protein n=1 Tax=Pyricularia oryzae TaxID=318829 RepID=A0A4P7N9E0_PYROR|nr:hypothetical protein PoMZ_02559 [Pyricularia oryzae]
MHPIILPQDLDALVKKFLGSLPTVCVTKSARPAPIAGFTAKHEIVGEKRKRKDTNDGSGPKVVDIIAELNLQQSGISKYEQRIPNPNLGHMIEYGIDKRVAYGY